MIVFTVDTRCKHGTVVIDQEDCGLCSWENHILFSKLPLKVKCINAKDCNLDDNAYYTVVAVINKGNLEEAEEYPCVLLQGTSGNALLTGYSLMRFVVAK